MAKSDYVDPNAAAFNAQLQTFKNNIGNYSVVLGLSPGQLSAQVADANYYNYILQCRALMDQGAQQWSAWNGIVRSGGLVPVLGAPVAPVFLTAVTAVIPGIETRFRALVKTIKASTNYNAAMGKALGIEGEEEAAPDLTTLRPEITVLLSGNQVFVKWGWGGNSRWLDSCELQVDRNDGKGFVFLAIDTTPGYTDTQPLPAVPAIWIYRAIYRVGDHQVGLWSNPVSLPVAA